MSRIAFITENKDLSVGSYRIWVNDLNNYFNKINIESKIYHINDDYRKLSDFDIIICSKNSVNVASNLKKIYPNKKVGVINLAASNVNLNIDFIIVGSIEEQDSLSHYNNVFMFPLIENMYQNIPTKKHTDSDTIRLGFHGSHTHLSKFQPNLKVALEELDNVLNLELLIISSDPNFNWKVGKPNIKNIKHIKWNMDTIKEDLLSIDIGIVPNITSYKIDDSDNSIDLGLYNTDYLLRMKNKSNAGRSFVFHQLGIPVVADLTPSNFHIMGNQNNGFLVSSKNGWKRSILKLTNYGNRNKISKSAKKEFDRLYNPYDWASDLYTKIKEI